MEGRRQAVEIQPVKHQHQGQGRPRQATAPRPKQRWFCVFHLPPTYGPPAPDQTPKFRSRVLPPPSIRPSCILSIPRNSTDFSSRPDYFLADEVDFRQGPAAVLVQPEPGGLRKAHPGAAPAVASPRRPRD